MTTTAQNQDPSSSSSYQTLLSRLTPPSLPHDPLSLPTSPLKPHLPATEIASLQLHPVIESALHILNHDLPAAHFLLRHMQAPPAWEAMYLHGILHRVEGDVDNARAWLWRLFGVKFNIKGKIKVAIKVTIKANIEGKIKAKGKMANSTKRKGKEKANYFALFRIRRVISDNNLTRTLVVITITIIILGLVLSHSQDHPNSNRTFPMPSEAHTHSSLGDLSLQELLRFLSYCEAKFGTDRVVDASGIWVSMADKHKDKAADMITGGEGWREF
ncbi:hypothetical protein A1O1_08441 [Capronia coronata CBS 617.96]|uniref:Uncharacterized protein n=1 Tax=Capronia coronata CBS 617.96 TaxID=1182541 RepID=W9YD93_9EURO|nr:uncharacterized protein A1O1_08441 [Capronia coronata CBS 617.96]EXJ80299.1 hypothetical protein A1O1_08441 [Capronia coronata CBS 617.96]